MKEKTYSKLKKNPALKLHVNKSYVSCRFLVKQSVWVELIDKKKIGGAYWMMHLESHMMNHIESVAIEFNKQFWVAALHTSLPFDDSNHIFVHLFVY